MVDRFGYVADLGSKLNQTVAAARPVLELDVLKLTGTEE